MIDDDLRLRARRLISGRNLVEDLDRLFLDQRDRHHGRSSIREIGDFVAHRNERVKGPLTQVARDVFTSVCVWSMGMRGLFPSRADIVRAAWANLRLASNAELKDGCGLRRGAVKKRFERILPRFERGDALSNKELALVRFLGNRFIWKPAFTDEELFVEFRDVLLLNAIISKVESAALTGAKTFLALYAISRMHGTAIVLEDGTRADLRAGFANRERRLEVKLQIGFKEGPKPILAPICMFLTSLQPENCCASELLELGSDWQSDAWIHPIEVRSDG